MKIIEISSMLLKQNSSIFKIKVMTRINIGIPVKQLTDKHLMAEHRELKRIPNVVSRGRYNLKTAPKEFTLGKGHVSFFYDKLGYLKDRYIELYNECRERGFNVQSYLSSWDGVPSHLMNNYHPTEKDIKIVSERIADRLANPLSKQKKERERLQGDIQTDRGSRETNTA
jgi:hypothetical protein